MHRSAARPTVPDLDRRSFALNAQPLVIQTEHLSSEAASWLAGRCRLEVCDHADPRFEALLAEASGLVVRTYTIVDEAMLAKAPKLKAVGRAGVGLDNIDVAACRRRGIEVVYTPDANTQAVVEYVIALLSDALRPRVVLTQAVDDAAWNRLRRDTVAARQMSELTLGILGLGRVGSRLATAARTIGFRVLYNDLREIPIASRQGAEPVPVERLFAESDVISIHIDGRAANRNFVGGRLLGLMKSGVLLINTSRGFVVDNLALASFLKSDLKALAMLDVHEPEPFGSDYPLLGLPNARLYPHLASRTDTAMNNMSWVVRDVLAVLEGRPAAFPAP